MGVSVVVCAVPVAASCVVVGESVQGRWVASKVVAVAISVGYGVRRPWVARVL